MRRILLAAALVAIMATASNAATYVWWELEGSNCDAVATGYGQGQALVIEKPLVAPEGFYEFTLVMRMACDFGADTQGLTGYRTSLWRGEDLTMLSVNPTEAVPFGDEATVGLLNPFGWSGTKSGTINNGPKVISSYGRNRQSGGTTLSPFNSPQNFIRFTLRIEQPAEEYGDTHVLYQTVGVGLFAQVPLANNRVFFGPNPDVAGGTAVDAWSAASLTVPVITIHAVPEPATLALLGFGFLALLRRR